jgi:hypothetical protein
MSKFKRYASASMPAAALAASILFYSGDAASEEAPAGRGSWKIGWTAESGYLKQSYGEHSKISVHLPEFVRNETAWSNKTILIPGLGEGLLTDNPLLHGAMYSNIRFTAEKDGISILTGLMVEHRGASYGVYTMDCMTVIPEFHARIDTFFDISGQRIRFGISAGNYNDFKLGEGLTVYNLDMQGGSVHAGWRGLEARYTQIGDLSMGIGLAVGEMMDYTLSLSDIPLFRSVSMDLQAGLYKIGETHSFNIPDEGSNFSAALEHPCGMRAYSQLGVRSVTESSQSGIQRCAHLAGVDYRLRKWNVDARLVAERRYYGRYFNLGYKSATDEFFYRSNSIYDQPSTVGDYIYPLRNFNRPFSQWAVYAEYQGRDVQTLIMRAETRYDLPRGFSLLCDLDLNRLEVSSEEDFLYSFYDAGAGWEPVDDILLKVTHTNRGMNLDMHYPTLYQMNNGTWMIELRANLAF